MPDDREREDAMELFRPVCSEEYQRIEALNFQGFPECGEMQPLFTALLSEIGAKQIARHLKTERRSDSVVYVVRFFVDDAYMHQYPIQCDHASEQRAVWIPAEDIEILNQHLIGSIQVIASYQVDRYNGDIFFV